jgi:hypothetical protein
MTFLQAKNRAGSTLASGIGSGDLSLSVAAGEGAKFPSTFPFHITIDNEILSCTNRSTDTLTVTRAAEGTTAASHSAGAAVSLNITAGIISEIQAAIGILETPNSTLARMTHNAISMPVMNTAVRVMIPFDTSTFDLGTDLVIGDLYGASGAYRQADADSDATHLQDDDAAFDSTIFGDCGHYVKWASNAAGDANVGEGYATYSDADTLTLYKSSGADFAPNYYYWIRKAYYVAPVAGYYDIKFGAIIGACEDGKRYYIGALINGSTLTVVQAVHASYAASSLRLTGSDLYHLAAGDKVALIIGNSNATAATCYPASGNQAFLAIHCVKAG